MKQYPAIQDDKNATLKAVLDFIARERLNDINDRATFPNIFMRGRKVGKVPSSSTDIAATDRIGDFNITASYLYLCVDNSGAAWRRVALGVW